LVNYINGKWEKKEILINNAIVIIAMNAFLSPTLRLIDFGYFFKLCKQKRLIKKFQSLKKEHIVISQRDANEIFEGPKFQLDNSFADLGKTGLLTFFFIPIFPIAVFISIFGLIYSYWIEKVNLEYNNSTYLSIATKSPNKSAQI
jgi:hypothetical protein